MNNAYYTPGPILSTFWELFNLAITLCICSGRYHHSYFIDYISFLLLCSQNSVGQSNIYFLRVFVDQAFRCGSADP